MQLRHLTVIQLLKQRLRSRHDNTQQEIPTPNREKALTKAICYRVVVELYLSTVQGQKRPLE